MGFVFKAVKSVVKAVVSVVKGVVKVLGKVVGGILSFLRPHGNAKNKATDGRLSKSLVPEDNRKIVFGKTCFGCDLRFWEIYGSDWTSYVEVIAGATHKVNSFGNFYAEDQLIGFNASGVSTNPKFAGLVRKTNNGAIGNAALTGIGSGSYWTSTSKFVGVAHYSLAWKTDEKSLPGGVPSRYTQEGEGAPVYDPRRDSTRGGSGTHRLDDQLTWEYAPLDSNGQPLGRNNALQMLWYLVGWRINGQLVAGRGVDQNDINWPEMIAAANDAEARGYYTDMCLSTGDAHETNEAIISCDGLMGEIIDPGGLWTYKITKDDTADIAVTLTDDDVIDAGTVEWTPAPSMQDQFNEVAGTFIDPSAASLYQSKAYPTVTDASYVTADGFRKRETHDFQSVQDAALAQKLARIKLNRARFPGVFKATFNLRALKAQAWSNVRLSLERYGFVSKLFRVYSQSITEQGIEMELREEDPSVYSNGTVTIPAAPGAIARFDPFQTYPVAGLTVSAISQSQASNNRVGVRLAWTALTNNVRRLELQYKRTADSTWSPGGYLSYDATTADLLGLLGTTGYDFRLRSWSNLEQPSAWATISKTTTALSTDWAALGGTIPAAVNNASVSISSNGALVGGGGGQVTYDGIGGGAYGDANRVRFSMLEAGTNGWSYANPNGTSFTGESFGTVHDAVSDRLVLSATFSGSGASAAIMNSAVFGEATSRIAVVPGERIFVGAALSASGAVGSWNLYASFKDDGNAHISGTVVDTGTGVLSNASRGGFVTVPAGAVYLSLEYYCYSSGAGAFTMAMARPLVCSAGTNQTTPPAFVPGPSNEPAADVSRWVQAPPQRLSFDFDYNNVAQDGEFPRALTLKLMSPFGQTVSGIAWKLSVISGVLNSTFSSSSGEVGLGNGATPGLTVYDMTTSSVKMLVTATYAGKDYSFVLELTKNVADAPVADTSTLATKTSGWAGINSSTFTTIGTLNCSPLPSGKSSTSIAVNLDCMVSSGTSTSSGVELKVLRDDGGGSLVQIGSTVSKTSTWFASDNSGDPASFSFTVVDPGRTAGVSYNYVIQARRATGTRALSTTGKVGITAA